MIQKKRIFQILKKFAQTRGYFLVFLIPYLIFSFATFRDYGIAVDEPIEYSFGEQLYARTFGRDPVLISDFAVERNDSREIWAYNHFHAMVLYMVNDNATIESYHLLNLLFGIVGFYLSFELVFLATHNAKLSILGPLFLFFTPRFLGDLPSNVKDAVFAVYYLLAVSAISFLPRYRWDVVRIVCVGVSIGVAAAFRVIGYGLLPVYIIFYAGTIAKKPGSWQKKSILLVGETVAVLALTVIIHAIEMPFVATNPFQNLLRLFELGKAYPWQGDMLYLGNIVQAGALPWHYVFVWAGVTTPLYVLSLWVLSHIFWKERVPQILNSIIWFNVGLYFLLRPTIYDGIRHFLFLLVIMSISASIAWVRLWQNGKRLARIVLSVSLLMFIVLTSYQYSRLHPYEYVYFNELAGGLPGAAGRFETDYWGTSYREAALWLHSFIGTAKTTVGICGNEAAQLYFEGTSISAVWLPNCASIKESGVQYVIASGRNGDWDRVNGKHIYSVMRDGVPLVKVFTVGEGEILPLSTEEQSR